MEQAKNCCGVEPIVWKSDDNDYNNDVEKIECGICGRIVWGADDESVAQWNDDIDDETGKKRNVK